MILYLVEDMNSVFNFVGIWHIFGEAHIALFDSQHINTLQNDNFLYFALISERRHWSDNCWLFNVNKTTSFRDTSYILKRKYSIPDWSDNYLI